MCNEDVQYTSIEAFRAAFYPHIAWWMDLPPDAIIEWDEFEDEVVGRHWERKRAAAAKE
jgi:hypothetical protein